MKFPKPISDFIAFTQTKPGEEWNLSATWERGVGWRVKWICAEQVLQVPPATARKLARYLKAQFKVIFRDTPREKRMPDQERRVFEWCERMDAYGKQTLDNNKKGMVPAHRGGQADTIAQACAAVEKGATA